MRWPWTSDPDAARHRAEQWVARGVRAAQAGRYASAVRSLDRAVGLDPTSLIARINLGSACYQLAQQREGTARAACLVAARAQFEYVLGIDAGHATAALNLAATLDALGESGRALELLEHLSERYPTRRDVWYNLALAHLRAGQDERAREAVLRELENHPDHEHATALLSRFGRPGGGAGNDG